VIEIDGYVTRKAVLLGKKVLREEELRTQMADRNYALGKRHFSYTVLRNKLDILLDDCFPCRLGNA